MDEEETNVQIAAEVIMDDEPDERGNVMIAALFDENAMIKLAFNSN